jgi:hypothetical protein
MKRLISCTMILMLLVLSAAPALAKQLTPGDFTDVQGHWAQKNISAVCNLGLMSGMGRNERGYKVFSPNSLVNRAQLAVVLQNTFELDYGEKRFVKQPLASDYYQDVDNQVWYAEAVTLAAINKVFDTNGNFYPQQAVTRIEVARAIHRCVNAKGLNIPMIMLMPYYRDMEGLSQEDTNALVFASNTSLMKGDGEYWRPHDNITRAELAVVLNGLVRLLGVDESDGQEYSLAPGNGLKVVITPDQAEAGAVKVTNRVVKENSDIMETDLNIPVVSGELEPGVLAAINKRFEEDAMKLKQTLEAEVKEYAAECEREGYPIRPYQLFTCYEQCFLNDDILSFYVDYYQYTGGAHGLTERRAYNIDFKTGELLPLATLFEPDYAYKAVIDKEINRQIALDPETYFEGDMGFQGIGQEQNYYLDGENLVIYFNQYEIAPYAAGIREFKIPQKLLD